MVRNGINLIAVVVVFLVLSSAAAGSVKEQQSEMVLTWRRDGGFAGFCDELQVLSSGEVRIQTCRPKTEKAGKLSSEDLARLNEWRKSFGAVSIDSKDGGVADGMSVTLTLKGSGSGQPTDAQRREMMQWAERVYGQSKS